MTQYLFNSDMEGWSSVQLVTWISDEGSPAVGCLGRESSFEAAGATIGSLSLPVSMGAAFSCRARLMGTLDLDFGSGGVEMRVISQFGTVLGLASVAAEDMTFTDGDTGWFQVNGTIGTAGTAFTLSVSAGYSSPPFFTTAYFDSVLLNQSAITVPDTRYLGISADSSKIYVTSVAGSALSFKSLTDAGTASAGTALFTAGDIATFGTAGYTDADTFTRGLFPVVKPGNDGIVYVYGRDGSNRQVLYNDLNGTAGWVDVGAGSATWGTAKFCVCLLPDPLLPTDIMAVFYDNDFYQTLRGTAQWVKTGDAPSNIRTAGRSAFNSNVLLAGGTAAGTLVFTQNWGVTFTSAGTVVGGTVAGTINSIEVSYLSA